MAPCRRLPLDQRDHAAAELHEFPGVDVVCAHRAEPAVAADPIHAQAGRERGDGGAVAHGHWQDARRDQQVPTRINAEGAQMDHARLAVLEQHRFSGGLVNRENRNVVLAAVGNLLALEVDNPGIAVGHIDEPSRGMDVDRTRGLPRAHIAGIAEGRGDE